MKTAVEWLIGKVIEYQQKDLKISKNFDRLLIANAKELEKQQMESCAIFFTNYAIDKIENKTNLKGKEQFEQYYTETYE